MNRLKEQSRFLRNVWFLTKSYWQSEERQSRFLRNVWFLTKSYWQSEERLKAFALLAVIIALTLAVVYVIVLINDWFNVFYEALQNYDTEKIFDELIHFSWLAALYIILMVYSFYLQQVLIINWRRWLTDRYIDEWLRNKTYYRLQVFGADTDNPDQRISEDVRLFVEMTLTFSIGVFRAARFYALGAQLPYRRLYGVGCAYLFGAWHLGNACRRQKAGWA